MLNLYGFMCQRILKLSGYSKSLACRAKSLWPYMVLQWWIIRWQTQHVRNLCSPSSVLKVKPAKMNLCSQSVLFKALSVGKLLLYCRAMICFVPIRYFTDLFESVCVCACFLVISCWSGPGTHIVGHLCTATTVFLFSSYQVDSQRHIFDGRSCMQSAWFLLQNFSHLNLPSII